MAEVGVLFVCTGNICRSPSAEGVARKLLIDAGLDARVTVDFASVGTKVLLVQYANLKVVAR